MTVAKTKKSGKRRSPLDTRLFLFTSADERAIRRAIRHAKAFMATFGQAPAQPPIDLSHYINSDKTKWYDGK